MLNKVRRAFTLTELLIAMVITVILGGCVIGAFHLFINSFYQLDDYGAADLEIELAVQQLTREFALIGLGMPNNRQGRGSFALSFRDTNTNNWPPTASFGEPDSLWGGPVTVSATSSGTPVKPASRDGSFIGPELYYAWAVPTGVKVSHDIIGGEGESEGVQVGARAGNRDGDPVTLGFLSSGDVAGLLKNFRWDTRDIGIPAALPDGSNMRTWLAFPTLGLPMRAESWVGDTGINVKVAPVPDTTLKMESPIMEVNEVHLIQAARLYRKDDNTLVRSVLGGGEDVLARNVAALQFSYNPTDRFLSMFIAVRGRERPDPAAPAPDYPSWLPAGAEVSPGDLGYHIIGKTFVWRIRN